MTSNRASLAINDNNSRMSVELQNNVNEIEDTTATMTTDPYAIQWDGENDRGCAQNWSEKKKWLNTLFDALASLITLMSGAALAPAILDIAKDLSISQEKAQLILSIFVLSFGLGALIFAPLAELWGRRPVFLACLLIYCIFSVICAIAKTPSTLIAARLFSGLGASATFAISMPGLSDCWEPSQRGRSLSVATTLPFLGTALGPILGGLVVESLGWRWIFYIMSMVSAVIVTLGFFMFKETRANVILQKRCDELNRAHNTKLYHVHPSLMQRRSSSRFPTQHILQALIRPPMLLLSRPILQMVSILMAYNFGILYLVLATFATLFIQQYGDSPSEASLHYIALSLGYLLATQIGGYIMDKNWKRIRDANTIDGVQGEVEPEARLPMLAPGGVALVFGLLLMGWAAEYKVFWLAVDIGVFFFGMGIVLCLQPLQAYIMDSFPECVGSANAAAQLARSIFGFVFPIFAPALYGHLGYGWTNTLLAMLLLCTSLPIAVIIFLFGDRLRQKPLAWGSIHLA